MKLTRDVSQATCKVCQNKIVIRKDGGAGQGAPAPRTPAATPTILSAEPPPALSSTAPIVSPFAENLPEQEMSESWREAIVDNRATIDLLKKVGVSVPDERSTAAGAAGSHPGERERADRARAEAPPPLPKASPTAGGVKAPVPPAPAAAPASKTFQELTPGESLDLAKPALEPPRPAPATPTQQARMAASPRAPIDDTRGASALVSLLAGAASLAVAGVIAAEGTWSQGLGTLAAIGAAVFAGVACTLNGLLRRRGIVALLAILVLAGGAAAITVLGVFLLGGDDAHRMIEWHPLLAPLAPFVR